MPLYSLNAEDIRKLMESMEAYGNTAGKAIDEVLHKEGAELIKKDILPLIHPSGRSWRGKKKSATVSDPFRQKDEPLAVTIRSKKAYQYLYFPDDGSNTKRHAGEQFFMIRGTEKAAPEIVELCLNKLVEEI